MHIRKRFECASVAGHLGLYNTAYLGERVNCDLHRAGLSGQGQGEQDLSVASCGDLKVEEGIKGKGVIYIFLALIS